MTRSLGAGSVNRDLPFHDDGEGEDDGEEDGLRVGPDGLADAHLFLLLGGLCGIVDEGIVVLDLGGDGGGGLGVDASDVVAVVEDHCCERERESK